MTDIYIFGCKKKFANRVTSNILLVGESPGPDSEYCYWDLKPSHGEMDMLPIEEQWPFFGDPDIPRDTKLCHIEYMQTAAHYRYQMYQLIKALLNMGDQPHFIDNDLGSHDGEWCKLTQPEPMTAEALLSMEFYHGDRWIQVISLK